MYCLPSLVDLCVPSVPSRVLSKDGDIKQEYLQELSKVNTDNLLYAFDLTRLIHFVNIKHEKFVALYGNIILSMSTQEFLGNMEFCITNSNWTRLNIESISKNYVCFCWNVSDVN